MLYCRAFGPGATHHKIWGGRVADACMIIVRVSRGVCVSLYIAMYVLSGVGHTLPYTYVTLWIV